MSICSSLVLRSKSGFSRNTLPPHSPMDDELSSSAWMKRRSVASVQARLHSSDSGWHQCAGSSPRASAETVLERCEQADAPAQQYQPAGVRSCKRLAHLKVQAVAMQAAAEQAALQAEVGMVGVRVLGHCQPLGVWGLRKAQAVAVQAALRAVVGMVGVRVLGRQ